jgi:hypothetical protein
LNPETTVGALANCQGAVPLEHFARSLSTNLELLRSWEDPPQSLADACFAPFNGSANCGF